MSTRNVAILISAIFEYILLDFKLFTCSFNLICLPASVCPWCAHLRRISHWISPLYFFEQISWYDESYLVTQENDFFDFLESSLFSRNRFVIYLISIKVYSYQNNNVFHSLCLVFLSKPFKLYLFDVKHSAENVWLKLKTD